MDARVGQEKSDVTATTRKETTCVISKEHGNRRIEHSLINELINEGEEKL